MTLALAFSRGDDIVDAYRDHVTAMPVQPEYQRTLMRAAEEFLAEHPDLDAWMRRSVEARLAELSRRPDAWPVIVFALLSG